MEDEEYDVLGLIHDMQETERSFYNIVRFLDGQTRGRSVNLHLQNTNAILRIVQDYMRMQRNLPVRTHMTLTFPAMDISGNFFEPVPIVPTQAQIRAAVDTHVGVTDTTCSICQEPVTCATRIRHCGHCFHGNCIQEWFSRNPRCPMCRYDIREEAAGGAGRATVIDGLINALNNTSVNDLRDVSGISINETHRMHSNEE